MSGPTADAVEFARNMLASAHYEEAKAAAMVSMAESMAKQAWIAQQQYMALVAEKGA